jgi:hypothetical protein
VEQLRGCALDKIGDAGPGMFVVDETDSSRRASAQPRGPGQYTGISGKIDNC